MNICSVIIMDMSAVKTLLGWDDLLLLPSAGIFHLRNSGKIDPAVLAAVPELCEVARDP